MGPADIQLGNLNAKEVIASMGHRGQVVAFNCQRQSRHGFCKEQQSHSWNQDTFSHTDVWHWLDDHGISISKIDMKTTKFLLNL